LAHNANAHTIRFIGDSMNYILAIAAVVMLASVPAQAATRIDDPVAFVTGVYAKLHAAEGAFGTNYQPPDDIYTPRLAALVALEMKDAGGEVGRLDFDFWVNGQDWVLSDVKVSGDLVPGAKDRKVVVAKFKNCGNSETIQFYFEKTARGWKLDDVRSVEKDSWTLSLILKYGSGW
jgi:hypothetical protein